ncbi:MAG: prohibitin family protein [Oscillospiraceae bacterium]|nr:prohibitin family protein [Oscillospiraceae bacterium]
MIFFIAGIAAAAAILVFLKGKLKALAAVGILIALFGCVVMIPTGYTGVVTVFGRVTDKTLEAGLHFVAPWYSIVKMDNRTQRASIETQAFSSDIQQVDVIMSVNYSIDKETAQELYKSVGRNYYENIVYPRILECTKACFSQYTAESLVANRNVLSGKIMSDLSADMRSFGVKVINVSIEDIDFTDAFTDAVEAKQVAEQQKLKAAIEQEQLTLEAEAEAKRAVLKAESDLEVARMEAESNEILSASFSENLIEYYYIQKWNGVLPQVVSDSSVVPILKDTD